MIDDNSTGDKVTEYFYLFESRASFEKNWLNRKETIMLK